MGDAEIGGIVGDVALRQDEVKAEPASLHPVTKKDSKGRTHGRQTRTGRSVAEVDTASGDRIRRAVCPRVLTRVSVDTVAQECGVTHSPLWERRGLLGGAKIGRTQLENTLQPPCLDSR